MYIWGILTALQCLHIPSVAGSNEISLNSSPDTNPTTPAPTIDCVEQPACTSSICLVCSANNIFNTTATNPKSISPTEDNLHTILTSATTTEIEESQQDVLELNEPQLNQDDPETRLQNTSNGQDVFSDISSDLSIDLERSFNKLENNSNYNDTNITLDECHFMSFEEWKKVKMELDSEEAKNTSDERMAGSRNSSNSKYISNSGNISNSRDFSTSQELALANSTQIKPPIPDEGKVYKDKFNYASVDCAATVVKTNSLAKGASSILFENKDSYLLNQCALPNKFVIIELCQDILVDSVVMGNFEFFSSMFRDIKISVSDRFPSTAWKVLGEFEAQNIRDLQSFKIQNPFIWARYLKLEILSHYGNEFYCPISIVRVHGKTMMEDFKEEEAKEEDARDDIILPISIDNFTTSVNDSIDKCRVVLPHLVLDEFLRDINSTYDYCDVVYPETTATSSEPTTQESIYKNIIKRLLLLESNATLSLLYIEEQSKLLSTAFTSLERRQTNNFDILISNFNLTLSNQLASFKTSYLKMYNEYSSLFGIQENHHKSLLHESTMKMNALTDELAFQRRITIFNSVIIMCLLVYVILTRDIYIDVGHEKAQKHYDNSPRLYKFKKPLKTKRYSK